MCKCLFGRKYDESAIIKLGWCDNKFFTANQLSNFKARKLIDGPKAHWGQPSV
jgi:hypothetical protein